ncbi:TPA: Bcr/CflA family multidrug efflux MFS transporter [Vibrio parahaemolyticus]
MTENVQSHSSLHLLLFIVLGAIGALTPLAIDMYLPAMPSIATDLGVPDSSVQITLTAYTAGFALGQLIHGPLADSFGRKPILLIGVIFFAMASILCATTADIQYLTYARIAQGFAGAAAAVIIQAIVRDRFEREDFAKAMSFITLVITIAPLIAPILGGHLATWFGWRSIFEALTLFSLIVIVLVIWQIPETLQSHHRQTWNTRTTVKNYAKLFSNPTAIGLMLSSGFAFGGMFAFLTAGSFVYIEIYGLSTDAFGYLFGLNIIAMIMMTTFNGRAVKKIGSHAMLRIALTIQLFAGLGLLVCWMFDGGLWGTVPFVVLFVGTQSTIGSNAMALLLSDPTTVGTAASLAGTLRFGMGSLIGAFVAILPDGVAWPMVTVMSLCAILSTLLYLCLGRKA